MKSRAEIKAQALANFKANYWPVVGILVLMTLIMGALSATGIGSIILLPSILVGMSAFCIAVYNGDREDQTLGYTFGKGFDGNFGRNIGSIIVMEILLCLWSLLFVIPGIIKGFAYAMTPYILADCPDVKAIDAITISRRMMKGHKWEFFVFNLSFIGWVLLSALTCGILNIFYVQPYVSTATAGYYQELKQCAIDTGAVSEDEFNGAPLSK